MTYEELKKQATPGPWTANAYDTPFRERYCISGICENFDHEEDAQLVAHCVNNFDKALEALKECVTDHAAFCLSNESVEAAHRRISAINRVALTTITELETVED